MGYSVDNRVISLDRLGVPQLRRRHVLLGLKHDSVTAESILASVEAGRHPARTLRWAIEDLAEIDRPTAHDRHPSASDDNLKRMSWLIANDKWDLPNRLRPKCHQDGAHSYKSMYGRLSWDAPAQTITSGFGSIGQGRYMHPDQARALTSHEAARIQGFPDYFDFSCVSRRTSLATMIGNAVPPALSHSIFNALMDLVGPDIWW
jgi:DNA (cytosine-5)-methyltransferase 1